jgi:hypothetical protein
VFRKNALEVQSYLLKHFPDMEFEINATVPRKGSFEFVLDVDGVGMNLTFLFKIILKSDCMLF